MDNARALFRDEAKLTNQPREENSMKAKNLLTVCGMAAALMLSAGSIYAQNGGGGGGGGNGGGGGFGGGGRNFDPAQMQQRIMDNIREQLNFTNDTDWSAVQPLVQKVMDSRMAVGFGGGMRGMFGSQPRRRRRWRRWKQPVQSAEPGQGRLQQGLDDNAPAAQIQALLAKYQASQKAKQAALHRGTGGSPQSAHGAAGGPGDFDGID